MLNYKLNINLRVLTHTNLTKQTICLYEYSLIHLSVEATFVVTLL